MIEFSPHERLLVPEMDENDDYDVYLFWPSLRLRESAYAGNEHGIYGPVVPSFGYDDYDVDLEYLPSSPLSFSLPGSHDFRFPNAAQCQPGTDINPTPTTGYSKLVKMGLLFSHVTHRLNHILNRMRRKLQKVN
ncbi:hypothetical protein EW146_g4020 [Bondarzewia mesenterica]|uniref:Uncharacterized protein n=1 Tax=Bondarzewia mesenterica TaxID=1095465 RepID=A0A4V3XFA3_9AGAM|nr:hypothetical protein EW146_g4020 [Bondarzewia mesenterica]